MAGLDSQLPSEPNEVRQLCLDLMVNAYVLQDRAKVIESNKDIILQLVEEKHKLLHNCRVYEKSASILDKMPGETFLEQLQYWQDETEKQALTITQMKLALKQLQKDKTEEERFYKECLEAQRKEIEELSKAPAFNGGNSNDQLNPVFRHENQPKKASIESATASFKIESIRASVSSARPKSSDLSSIVSRLTSDISPPKSEDNLDIQSPTGMELSAKEFKDSRLKKLMVEGSHMSNLTFSDSRTSNFTFSEPRASEAVNVEGLLFQKTDTGQLAVKAGTIDKLIERLLDPSVHGKMNLMR